MKIESSNYRDMLDIIFEHKNKNYGAYQIRREYPKNLIRASAYFLGGLSMFFAVPYLMASFSGSFIPEKNETSVEIFLDKKIEIEKIKPVKIEKIIPTELLKRASVLKFVPPVLVENTSQAIENPPKINEILDSKCLVGKIDQPVDPNLLIDLYSDFGKVKVEDHQSKIEEPEEIFTVVDKAASFPGGYAEMLKYLNAHIKYPSLAKESNIQGRVVLTFLVGKSGKIEDVKIIKDPGGGCGKEAVRVVQSMPNWNPGEQGGHAVKVRFTLPVMFHLN